MNIRILGNTIQPITGGNPPHFVSWKVECEPLNLESLDIGVHSESSPTAMTKTSSMGWRGRREWGRCGSSFLGPEHLPRAVSCVPAPKPGVLASSQGHLFRTRDEKQSPGRVYGYFPPICQSWFTISGDKVWWPPPSPAKWTPQRKFLSCTVVTYCISQAMGKLGTSLSSGHVMVNGTRTQVLLVGAPTQGRSPAMKLHFFMNSCVTP